MSFLSSSDRLDRRFLILGGSASLVMLAGCSNEVVRQPQPSFYRNLANSGAQVDVMMAASMISGYRANNGRGAVVADPVLTRIAAIHAMNMANSDQVGSNPPLQQRLASGSFPARGAVENVSAGYMTLAEAFSGWRDSPPHKANMLNAGATRIGLGTSFRPGSKYRVFWCLILA